MIRGHNVMKGYYKRPAETAEALRGGWFHTGDIGVIDDDGYVTIVDRKKDMLIRGGTNVYPREIEEVLMTHPAVSLAAVIGIPDERLGEEVKAFVVLKPGAALTADALIAWAKGEMAAFKYPRVDRVPRLAAHRPDRQSRQAPAAVGENNTSGSRSGFRSVRVEPAEN